ncbi:MAG: TonB-dependent receptor [Prevotellaceae bacterium]|nr:TonB-dependent receptor [Prevotellaceae bacterium]
MTRCIFTLLAALLLAAVAVDAKNVKGKVKDSQSGEEIIGATIVVKDNAARGTVTGLDGSFTLSIDGYPCTLVCTYVGYKSVERTLKKDENNIAIALDADNLVLGEVTIVAQNPGRTEVGARGIERQALNVVNVMSAKAIELSPDLTVANVIQRMSGVTMERSSSGEGQYAILRGMDKRYNYTLVNGVKIPSPDNKNRFVPLDIFPSELLDRLEVVKSLTANLEGDGIGGAVNMVMKDAPGERQLTANLSTGYSLHFLHHDFQSFSAGDIARKSPNEEYGDAYPADATDFTMKNLRVKSAKPLPDLSAGFSYGDRFLGEHLGLMAALSYSNRNKGKVSDMYESAADNNGVQSITNRYFSERQTRVGAHLKLDYYIDQQNKITWYNGCMDFRDAQTRDAVGTQDEIVRLRLQHQRILNSTLKGEHKLLLHDALGINWGVNIAGARNYIPDNAQIQLKNNTDGAAQWVNNDTGAIRRWEHNSDDDISGYLDLSYQLKTAAGGALEFTAGGMYRDKKRASFYHEYNFQPYDESKPDVNRYDQYRGEDWDNYDEISFRLSSYTLSDPMNYDATEKIGAGYGQLRYTRGRWQVVGGLRVEHTDQGYTLLYPTEGARGEGSQRYTDFLPDVHIRYNIHKDANLRLSYYRAVNRPSFFEIVPYHIINEDYNESGNPDLKHTTAENFDLRYEYFPKPTEQVMACLFYKKLKNPIEYGMQPVGQETFYTPGNYGDAGNWGVELDVMKYFRWFGVKANYTFIHSSITTSKLHELTDENGSVYTVYDEQTRPLFGQAAHVFNCSLLFKDARRGWDGQIAFSRTGKRVSVIDRFYENDRWDAGVTQLDVSAEKQFKCGLSLFLKGQNLLNTPLIRYYHANDRNASTLNVRRYDKGVVEREEKTGQSFLLGMRYKL